ncbi:hypothetical protein GCM10028820_22950 [Tessaracoccus terricola]
MQTLDELAHLARGTFGLWRRHLPALLTWLALGWSVRELSFHVGVLLGPNRLAALACFAFGMVFWVVCIIAMLFTVTRHPKAFDEVTRTKGAPPIRQRRWRDVMIEAVVPFLALYAVWGLTEDQVQRAFSANLTWWGIDAANFSISFADWRLYLVVTVVAWALQAGIAFLARDRKGVLVSVLLTFLRGVAILTAFLGLDTIWNNVTVWLKGRQVWQWGTDAWDGFVVLLPEFHLPAGITLPEAVDRLGLFIWHGLLPGLLGAVLLPLLWLALTALTVGWHDFTSGVAGGRLLGVLDSASDRARRLGERRERTPLAVAGRVAAGQLEPLLPVVEAFRLVIRAGLPLLGAYLVLAATGRGLSTWLDDSILWLVGPNSTAITLRYAYLTELVAELLAWPLLACLYATTFDRVLQVTLKEPQPAGSKPIPSGSPA